MRDRFISKAEATLCLLAAAGSSSGCIPIGKYLEKTGRSMQGGTAESSSTPIGTSSEIKTPSHIKATSTPLPTITPFPTSTITSSPLPIFTPTPNFGSSNATAEAELNRAEKLGNKKTVELENVTAGGFLKFDIDFGLGDLKKSFIYMLLTKEVNGEQIPYALVEEADCYYNFLIEEEGEALGEITKIDDRLSTIPITEPYSNIKNITLVDSETAIDRMDKITGPFGKNIQIADLPSFSLRELEINKEDGSGSMLFNCQ